LSIKIEGAKIDFSMRSLTILALFSCIQGVSIIGRHGTEYVLTPAVLTNGPTCIDISHEPRAVIGDVVVTYGVDDPKCHSNLVTSIPPGELLERPVWQEDRRVEEAFQDLLINDPNTLAIICFILATAYPGLSEPESRHIGHGIDLDKTPYLPRAMIKLIRDVDLPQDVRCASFIELYTRYAKCNVTRDRYGNVTIRYSFNTQEHTLPFELGLMFTRVEVSKDNWKNCVKLVIFP